MAKKKNYLKNEKCDAIGSDMFRQSMKLTVESEEERKKRIDETRKRVLSLYKKGMTQAEALAAIDELHGIENYDDGLMKDAKKFLKVIMNAQHINEFQALVFSIMFCCARNSMMTAYEIGNIIGKSGVWVLQHIDEIEEMCIGQRQLLVATRRQFECLSGYSMRPDVFKAVLNNETYVPKSMKKKNVETLLYEFRNLTALYEDDNNFDNYQYYVDKLLSENTHLPFVNKLYKTFHTEHPNREMRMLMMVCESTIRGWGRMDIDDMVRCVSMENDERLEVLADLKKDNTYLQHKKLIEPGCDDGLADRTSVCLTAKAMKKFLPGVKTSNRNETSQTDLIKHEKIEKKELFYDDAVRKNVDDLNGLLTDAKFKDIQARLKAKKQRTGFCALFYGAPGVGKTEAVLQMARSTKRDVIKVNISEVRSMWVGESEKNVQAIFDNYKELLKSNQRCPILLFNESDSIISKRMDGASHAVDKMENNIVSIILNAMEEFEGILIATTNLVDQTLDPAFERRFLYKVKFERPTKDIQLKIWQSVFTDVDTDVLTRISERFDFSGGQIENVARRWNIDEILYGTLDDPLKKLTELCENEKLEKLNNRKIGFKL